MVITTTGQTRARTEVRMSTLSKCTKRSSAN